MIKFIKNIRSLLNSKEVKLDSVSLDCEFTSVSVNQHKDVKIISERAISFSRSDGTHEQYNLQIFSDKILAQSLEDGNLKSIKTFGTNYSATDYRNKIPEIFQHSMEQAKQRLSQESIVTSDLANETKGLEWLRVSMVVLKEAIKKSISTPNLIYTGQYFSGHRDKNECFQIRIRSLSLDFLLLFLEDGRLNITVWDYKNNIESETKKPVFEGEFVKLKQPVFDEFIHLIVEISKAATKF